MEEGLSMTATTTPQYRHTLEWEDIGEGLSGDYLGDGRGDIRLLRFTINGGAFDGTSYCTDIEAGAPESTLKAAAARILEANTKRAIQEETWTRGRSRH